MSKAAAVAARPAVAAPSCATQSTKVREVKTDSTSTKEVLSEEIEELRTQKADQGLRTRALERENAALRTQLIASRRQRLQPGEVSFAYEESRNEVLWLLEHYPADIHIGNPDQGEQGTFLPDHDHRKQFQNQARALMTALLETIQIWESEWREKGCKAGRDGMVHSSQGPPDPWPLVMRLSEIHERLNALRGSGFIQCHAMTQERHHGRFIRTEDWLGRCPIIRTAVVDYPLPDTSPQEEVPTSSSTLSNLASSALRVSADPVARGRPETSPRREREDRDERRAERRERIAREERGRDEYGRGRGGFTASLHGLEDMIHALRDDIARQALHTETTLVHRLTMCESERDRHRRGEENVELKNNLLRGQVTSLAQVVSLYERGQTPTISAAHHRGQDGGIVFADTLTDRTPPPTQRLAAGGSGSAGSTWWDNPLVTQSAPRLINRPQHQLGGLSQASATSGPPRSRSRSRGLSDSIAGQGQPLTETTATVRDTVAYGSLSGQFYVPPSLAAPPGLNRLPQPEDPKPQRMDLEEGVGDVVLSTVVSTAPVTAVVTASAASAAPDDLGASPKFSP